MIPTTTCSCGQARSGGAGISTCRCGRKYVVVKNGDVGTTSYAIGSRKIQPGAVVKDGKLVRSQ